MNPALLSVVLPYLIAGIIAVILLKMFVCDTSDPGDTFLIGLGFLFWPALLLVLLVYFLGIALRFLMEELGL